jgi:hypothetical protein
MLAKMDKLQLLISLWIMAQIHKKEITVEGLHFITQFIQAELM